MTIIILHGWGHNKQLWQPVVEKLQTMIPGTQVEAWDLPGFGDEPLVSADWDIPDYAAWVEERIEGSIVLVGHSFGGRIAAYLASRQPEWLSKLVLIGAPLLRRPSLKVRLKIAIYKLGKRFIPQAGKQKVYNEEQQAAQAKNLGKIFRNAVEFDQTEFLPQIKVPTLLLWGENDQEAPLRIAKEAATLIPNSELDIWHQQGHNLHLEAPDLVAGKIKRFVSKNSALSKFESHMTNMGKTDSVKLVRNMRDDK